MNEPVTVTYSLEDVLKRIEDKLDSNQKELSQKIDKQSEEIGDIKVKLTAVETELKGMNKRLERVENTQDTLVKEVSDLKGFRSLILPIIVGGISAVIGAIVTVVARLAFFTNNP
ncbi:shikimate dehydrogenase [Crocosphaera sp. UHCC 0190]|uniref:shikimate dehydrogenase n=1 Tax=Crocosphaera sp. UHCC 0190 TaxID=3110246 RepID=UPI002B21637A|nr:shikimate dehydrogenase [Crocosphaera sp. UHCC 0190]MEA5511973.1 shikimate dehydrogenase [Crocosphaera sp. UHCC 0190]